MRNLILVAAVAALAGCSQQTAAPPAEEANLAAAEAASAWPLEAGTYEYSRSDGVAGVNTIAADGSYSNAITGGETETGTWANEGSQGCFVPAEGTKRCYTFTQPDANGNFTGTMADGTTVTVRKVA